MAETRYTLPVSADTRIRHYHLTERGRVVRFVIQLEVQVKASWKSVIRYDNAHGFAHVDRFNLKRGRRKETLSLNFEEALTRAERDIKQNWSIYRERFLRGEFP